MHNQEHVTLYDRLGGVYSIATVVDDFIDRIMVDPRLNANPHVDEAHHRVTPAGFKYLVTEMVCWATGGPQQYSGRAMGDSHRHLMITPQEWQAFWMTFSRRLTRSTCPNRSKQSCLRSSKAHGKPLSLHLCKSTQSERVALTEETWLVSCGGA
jgi:hemoglobin